MTPTKIGFEKQYADGSGVEFGVYYHDARDGTDQISITRVSSTSLPIDQLDWLIECLQKIRQEVVTDLMSKAQFVSPGHEALEALREKLAASFLKSTEKG